MVAHKGARIAILLPSLNGGGAERVALFFAEVLDEAGYAVDLVVAVNRGALVDHPVAQRFCVDLKAPNEMLCVPHLLAYEKRARPDLILAFCHTAKIMAGIAKRIRPRLPLALSVHAALEIPKANLFWFRRWLGFAPERWLYRGVLGCHVVSRALVDQVRRRFAIPEERVHLIYNPLPERPARIVELNPCTFHRPFLMTAGRLTAQKDQSALLRAFARSGLAGSTLLLILGEGELRGRLEAEAKTLGIAGAVIFGGFQPDILSTMVQAKGFLLSSVFEGFALVLVEALMAHLPVASFDCPSGPREVLDDGRLGRLLPPGDIDGLAAAMRAMIDGSLPPPSAEAVAQSVERFAPDRIASQYIAFVERCLTRAESEP